MTAAGTVRQQFGEDCIGYAHKIERRVLAERTKLGARISKKPSIQPGGAVLVDALSCGLS